METIDGVKKWASHRGELWGPSGLIREMGKWWFERK